MIEQGKCEIIEDILIQELNKQPLDVKELAYIIGSLMIDIGGSLMQNLEPITYEQMRANYLQDPKLATAMMAVGADIHTDWLKIGKETGTNRR